MGSEESTREEVRCGLKWCGHVLRREEECIRRQESDGDRGAGEKKERNTKSEVGG